VLKALAVLLSSSEGLVRFFGRFGIDLQELPAHERQEETFEDRIRRLAAALESSAATISEIQGEIDRRQSLVEQLQQDANRYEQLSKLKRAEAEAVAQLVEGKLKQGERRSLWVGFAMNFVFFLLGVAASFGLEQVTS
jgi:TolA-binding protein